MEKQIDVSVQELHRARQLGQKTRDALYLASLPGSSFRWWFEEYLVDKWGAKVLYTAMERISRRGWLDCGVSTRTGWLTPSGMRVLTCVIHTSRNDAKRGAT